MSARKRNPPQAETGLTEEPIDPQGIEEATVEAEADEGTLTEETAEETQPGLEITTGIVRPRELGEQLRLQQESTAKWLALLVVGIFGLLTLSIVLCGFGSSLIAFLVAAFSGTDQATAPAFDALEAAKVLLPYLATPLGVAMGYYFTRRATEAQK